MSTERSWTDHGVALRGRWDDAVRACLDLRALVAFRAAALRGRRRVAATASAVVVGLTALAALLPAYLPGAAGTPGAPIIGAEDLRTILPHAYLSVLAIAIISAAASGGGRELLAREQGVAFPVSPTTDHLGALLMAPLNIVWLLQAGIVLGGTAFVVGPRHLWAAQLPVLLWIALATALAQVAAWLAERARRGTHGVWVVRGSGALLAAVVVALTMTGAPTRLLDVTPTSPLLTAASWGSAGRWVPWLVSVAVLLGAVLVTVAAGAGVAHLLARHPPREEARVETVLHQPRPNPVSDFAAMLRVDRAAIWRSAPLRRGFSILAVMPGLAALAAALEWSMVMVIPGLVASAAALLFGVNSWCLDARGALWRASLPVAPRLAFWVRVVALLEMMVLAVLTAVVLAALRAGAPTVSELVAIACVTSVVALQVLSASMRWSVRRPFAVDMRSVRATPAPPLTMVGYSTRLAVATTFSAMLFVGTSQVRLWQLSTVLATPFLLVSLHRLRRAAAAWDDPATRSSVVTTVAA